MFLFGWLVVVVLGLVCVLLVCLFVFPLNSCDLNQFYCLKVYNVKFTVLKLNSQQMPSALYCKLEYTIGRRKRYGGF